MRRRIVVLAGALVLVLVAAPAAWAGKVPFNVHVPVGGIGPVVVGVEQEQDTGLVGLCDPELGCTGFRVTEATSNITGGTTPAQVTLRGWVCVQDSSTDCSAAGDLFTGVNITERVVDTPEAYLGPIFVHVNVCLWVMSPADQPHACDVPALLTDETSMPDSGNLAEGLPAGGVGLTFSDDDD